VVNSGLPEQPLFFDHGPLNAALLYALAAAGANLAGGLLITAARPRSAESQRMLIAFGGGFMLATVCVGMLPEALEARGAPVAVLVGYLLVHLTQHVVTPHFHFGEETHHHEMVGRWVGITALVGLLLHTFFDGVAIASAFGVGAWLGLLVFVAILLHKIPEGITVASIMLASGNSRRRALCGVALLGVSTVLGVLLTRYIAVLAEHGLALSAGVTLYVAASNLIPEVQKGRSWPLALAVFGGAGLYLLASQLVHGFVH
jgi:ZIP family zinc transporter/zinc and cadmium transporter